MKEPIFIYYSHTGELYYTEKQKTSSQLYCEMCGDSDLYIGKAWSKKEARTIIQEQLAELDEAYVQEFVKGLPLKTKGDGSRTFFTKSEQTVNVINPILEAMVKRKWHYGGLSKKSGIAKTRVSQIFGMDANPTLEEIISLAVALDLKLVVQEEEKK